MTQERNFPLESFLKWNTKVYLFIHYDDLVPFTQPPLKVSFCKLLSTHRTSTIGFDSNSSTLYTPVTKQQLVFIANFSVQLL